MLNKKVKRTMIGPSLEWRTRYVRCNLCDRDCISELWIKDGFRYVRCQNCGLIYVNPQLLPSEIEAIYAVGYQSKSADKPRPKDFLNYQPLLRWAAQYRKNTRLLDVGCFKGYLLMAAREQGWLSFGTEISAQATEYVKQEEGLDVFLGSLPKAGYPDEYFDVVVMQDVIEHLSDPLGYLQEIYRILRPGGGLYIDTPNFNSVTRYFLGKDWSVFFPWHQYYFTPRTLQQMIEKSSFTLRCIQCIGLAPFNRYNAFRSLQQKQEIACLSKRHIKELLKRKVPFLKRSYFFSKSIGNTPFRIFSAMGIHIGTKMIAFTKKQYNEK